MEQTVGCREIGDDGANGDSSNPPACAVVARLGAVLEYSTPSGSVSEAPPCP